MASKDVKNNKLYHIYSTTTSLFYSSDNTIEHEDIVALIVGCVEHEMWMVL
ncbi:MAG: hypothetical protein Sylvanvirus7_2 [Sylvanvirus sp.]|uniref:Uncharacterized protein n=1 Tax=Sylvanvirus sp. TaxID=2487774 RepID=A0A3G5AJB4_9VIRU|nr:MAG: hypothetical protein Sylvanvirus7_2 [Sylvanvirus sp.]